MTEQVFDAAADHYLLYLIKHMSTETTAMKPNHALSAGSIITHYDLDGEDREYTIEKVLGQPGGFGITYQATFLTTNEVSGNMGSFDSTAEVNVAIKEFFMNGCGRNADGSVNLGTIDTEIFNDFKDRFNEEAQILSKFHHLRYLVKVMDFFEANGTAYMVMKHITGSDLDHMVSPNQPMDEATAVKYIMEVAEDLRDVHEQGIVHRDIKPSNLMINRFRDPITKEKRQIATLIDFGAAKDYTEDSETSKYNIHTEAYAAPEQANPWGKKGRFTDIYSLCGTLYFMIEGRRPPVVTTRKESDPPLQMNHASPAIARIIDKGMSFKAENRYQDCMELLMDFFQEARWSEMYDREIFYEKPTIDRRIQDPIIEKPIINRGHEDADFSEEPFEPEEPTGGGKRPSPMMIGLMVLVLVAVAGIIYWASSNGDVKPENEPSSVELQKAQLIMNPVSGLENGGEILLQVSLDHAVTDGFTVDVNASDVTAKLGEDYELITQQLTFSGLEHETQAISVRPINDAMIEGDETLNISLSNLRNTEAEVDLGREVVVTIGNDDTAPAKKRYQSFEEALNATLNGDSDGRTDASVQLRKFISDGAKIMVCYPETDDCEQEEKEDFINMISAITLIKNHEIVGKKTANNLVNEFTLNLYEQ